MTVERTLDQKPMALGLNLKSDLKMCLLVPALSPWKQCDKPLLYIISYICSETQMGMSKCPGVLKHNGTVTNKEMTAKYLYNHILA